MTELVRPVRVLRVISRLNVGGPARHTVILNDGLRQHGFDTLLVHGAVGEDEASIEELAHDRALPAVYLPELGRRISVLSDVRAFLKILAIIRRWSPDIVHTHTAKAGALGRVAAVAYNVAMRRGRRRCVVVHTFHGHVLEGYFGRFGSMLVRVIERTLARATDCIVTISPRQREDISRRFAIAPASKVTMVPLGLELGELLGLEPRPVRAVGAGGVAADVVVGYVGRLAAIKDLDTLLRGVALARARLPQLRLVIVGDGERRAALEGRAVDLGLGRHSEFVGWRRDLVAVYQSMDLFVITSINEGTPVSLIEAMAAGVPAIATSVGGVPDVIQNGVTGVLIPPREPERLAAAIVDSVEQPDRASRMAARARLSVGQRFDSARLVTETVSIYRKILQGRRISDPAGPIVRPEATG